MAQQCEVCAWSMALCTCTKSISDARLAIIERFGDSDSRDTVAEIRRLRAEVAELRKALNSEDHVVEFTVSGWVVEHSISCRIAKQMATCAYHGAVADFVDVMTPPLMEELQRVCRWVLSFDQDGELKMAPDWKEMERRGK